MTDATGFETLDEKEDLRTRLARGGLAPEAVEKAVEAYEAGEIQSVPIIIGKKDVLHAEIPDDLLRKVFPIPGLSTLEKGELLFLEYEINRHRYGKKSLTLRWPGDEAEDENGEEAEKQPGTPPSGKTPPATSGRGGPKDPNDDEDPWPGDEEKK